MFDIEPSWSYNENGTTAIATAKYEASCEW